MGQADCLDSSYSPPSERTEKRYLKRNLPSSQLFKKISGAERRMEAGERELGFYLLDLKSRHVYRDANCGSFREFIRKRSGLRLRKATHLVQVALALESLPLMDQAFAEGKLYWSAVRAMVAVATPQTEAKWLQYALTHRVDEVEALVASSKPGEDPQDKSWKRRPLRYPYRFNVTAEKHQAFELLMSMLSKKNGAEMAIEDALFEAVQLWIAEELEADAGRGPERLYPSSLRQVIYTCPDCKANAAATSDGPVGIDPEVAKKLLEGAEVLDLTTKSAPKKCPIWDNVKTEVVVNPQSLQKTPEGEKVVHFSNLSTPDRPTVPIDERDIPNTPEITRKVLSRDGYYCRVPGCTSMAVESHHLEWRSQGGRTSVECEGGFCIAHHDMFHEGRLLVSGTGEDLRFSDQNLRPIIRLPSSDTPSVELEVEAKPAGTTSGSEAAAPAVEVPTAIPREFDRSFWRTHRHLFEWSERRNALIYHPEWASSALPEAEDEVKSGSRPPEGGEAGLEGFKGQTRAVRNLGIALRATKDRGELPDPMLLSGQPGLGKTTLAKLIARDLGSELHQVQGPALLDLGALVGVLSALDRGATLFVDEMHRVPVAILECLYQALDEKTLSLPVIHASCGASARFVKLKIEPFLLIGATTEESLLPKPLRSRFTVKERLEPYSRDELETMAIAAGGKLGVEVTPEGARALARGARGTPRILLGHLARARDLAQVEGHRSSHAAIDAEVAARALECQGIDRSGLLPIERKLLEALSARERPLGLRTLADLVGESPRTILEVHEPYLVQEGYLARTFRGRIATEKCRDLWR